MVSNRWNERHRVAVRNTYVGKLDVAVGDARDLASSTRDSLNAHTVVGVHDLRIGDVDGVNSVVVTAANGADGETVAARAVATSEGDISATVNSQAVVLVVDGRTRDGDLLGATDIEGVSVVATLGVAILVVDSDAVELDVGGTVDGKDLNWGVLDGLV